MTDYKIINIDDKIYPPKLREISNPPKKIYAIGNLNLLKEDMIAVVGSRKINEYGRKYAKYFSKEIALRNIPIVSGMAVGTDTEAHRTALEFGSPTIAVLGVGLDNIYPKDNLGLYNEILASKGLVITEEEPNVKYDPKIVINRNRIVSGLADCVVVIEAGYRSGTSITVEYAKEQNKEVFVIPGRLDDKKCISSNLFIKNGAKILTNIEDILVCYPQFMNKKRKSDTEKIVKSEYQEIYNVLKDKTCNIEEIYRKVENKSVTEITNLLTMMELEDIVVKDFGNGYKLKEDYA